MATAAVDELFSLQNRVAIVTGGTGVLGGAMARGLARAGAKVALLGRRAAQAEAGAAAIVASGGDALATPADVLRKDQLARVRDAVLGRWGRIDILVNAAGGNIPAATVGGDVTIFNMEQDAFRQVFDLNLLGTVLPCQVFGQAMAEGAVAGHGGRGSIINISSMSAPRAMTRVAGYGAAKAAVENFTRWLALELATRYGAGMRVNAIAPGFFIGEQNRRLLTNGDGSLTARGQAVVGHTPAGRFGEPDDLVGTLVWLCSPGASFVTGAVIPVDGGFSIFSGV